ncbi:MAG: alpha/beta hydrolase [Bifidobacterium sp.]|jgi:acetyl esterase/lipase|nr:alpha/beta hydrolase [Bifidobacterium sp.]
MRTIHRLITGIDGSHAVLDGYLIDNSPEIDIARTRPAIVIVPGGGYEFTSDREAEPIALSMLGNGFHAFVLRYSVKPSAFPCSVIELATAVSIIRDSSSVWNIDPNAVIVAGFSAGGHLCATLGTGAARQEIEDHGLTVAQSAPNGMMLGYAVITSGRYAHDGSFASLMGMRKNDAELRKRLSLEKQVTHSTPPTFIWHTITDDLVPVQNALLFIDACVANGVPVEAHLYPSGGHGLSLGTRESAWHGTVAIEPCVQSWPDLFASWVRRTFGDDE